MSDLFPQTSTAPVNAKLTFGDNCAERLWSAKAAHGKSMSKGQVAAIIDGTAKECGLTKKKARVNGRDQLFDGLCVACGIDPSEVTRPMGSAIGTALADIAAVTDDLTPEAFGQRAVRYKKLYPEAALTPSALASHWGELGTGDLGQTMASKHSIEPLGWQDALRASCVDAHWEEESIRVIMDRGWTGLSLTHRINIQRKLNSQKSIENAAARCND